MPIYSGGAPVKGIMGGYIEGRKQGQHATQRDLANDSTRISNAKQASEFLEWMDNRQNRDKTAESRNVQDQIDIDTANSREDATRAQNKASTEVATLQEETAEADRSLVEKKRDVQELGLDMIWRENRKKIKDLDVEQIASAGATYTDMLNSGKMSAEEAYRTTIDAILKQAPEGVQYMAQVMQDLGIPLEYSPEAAKTLQTHSLKATLDMAQRQKERLLMMEWAASVEEAKIKGMYGKATDLSSTYPKQGEMNAVGDRMMGYDSFKGLEGKYHKDKGKYTEYQGAVVTTISTLARRAVQDQKMGDPIAPAEWEYIYGDLFNTMAEQLLSFPV